MMLAGHRIEREARGNLGDTLGTLGDNNKLNQNDDQENHQTNDYITLNHELTERFDNLAGVTAIRQNLSSGGNIQRQSEQRGNQKHRGVDRKFQRFPDVHGREQDHEGDRQIGDEHKVQQPRRKRDDQQSYYGDDKRRNRIVKKLQIYFKSFFFKL